MNEPETINCLKHLSDTHRSLHDQRRQYEFKVVFSTISFYALAVAGKISGRVTLPTNGWFRFSVWIGFLSLAGFVAVFLRQLHKSHRINITIAEDAENDLRNMLGKSSPYVTRAWRWFSYTWEIVIIGCFAAAGAVLLTTTP